MTYFYMLEDLGMNYTLESSIIDGNATSRVEEVRSIAPRIVDFDSWAPILVGPRQAGREG